jgi:nucleoside-diphosphate-sugar epimerase
MRRAVIIGGTGLIGRAVARRLLAAGWQVDLTGRDAAHMPTSLTRAGARFIAADRSDAAALRAALGDGAELVADCLCYTAADAAGLLPLAHSANSTVMISSNAVYVDADGNHTNSDSPPHFAGPIGEGQPTMAPSAGDDYQSREGYGACKVAAEQVLLDSGAPVSVLRLAKVHGPWAERPREWVFVKRVLDRRPAVFLARRGAGVAHTVAADNVAALVETVADKPGRRILNSADPVAPSGLQIARTIAGLLGHGWEEILLDDPGGLATPAGSASTADPALGRHPWDARFPIVLDMAAALDLGYEPAGDYAATVAAEVNWLTSAAAGREGDRALAWLSDHYFDQFLDYAREDRYLAERARLSRSEPAGPELASDSERAG